MSKELLKQALNLIDAENLAQPLEVIHPKIAEVRLILLSILESQPEPGEGYCAKCDAYEQQIDRLTEEKNALDKMVATQNEIIREITKSQQAEIERDADTIVRMDNCITELEKENRDQQAEIERIRPKAECYERICQSLGIEKDILGYAKSQQAEIERLKILLNKVYNYTFNLNPSIKAEIEQALQGDSE